MTRVRLTLDVTIGKGRRAPRSKEEVLIIQLLEGRGLTMRELLEELTRGGKMPRNLAEKLIKGAVAVGVLSA